MNLENEIDRFIARQEQTGALLITGKWGCGKSYFIKEYSDKVNSKRKVHISVISLFGIDSVSTLHQRVKDEYLAVASHFITKGFRKFSKLVGKTIKAGVDVAATTTGNAIVAGVGVGINAVTDFNIFDFCSVKNTYGKGHERQFVLVFDDLERCKIDMTDLLGAINEYCENRGIKTIIIANEEEIGECNKNKKENDRDKQLVDKFTKQDSEDAAENNDVLLKKYKTFKEKLIFQTLKFDVSYDDIIEKIIESYAETKDGATERGYVNFLRERANIIKKIFDDSNSENLRTLKVVLTYFENIFAEWKNIDVAPRLIDQVFVNFSVEMYRAKGCWKKKPSALEIYGGTNKENSDIYGKYPIHLESIDSFIGNGYLDCERLKQEVEVRYNPKSIPAKTLFLTRSVYDLDYETIKNGLSEALKDAYNGTLCGRDLFELLRRLDFYSNNGITFPFDIDYEKIAQGLNRQISLIKENPELVDRHFIVQTEEIEKAGEKIKPLYRKLNYVLYTCAAWENQNFLSQTLKTDKGASYYMESHWVESFDKTLEQEFLSAYKQSDNADKRNLIDIFKKFIFTYSPFTDNNYIDERYNAIKITHSSLEDLQNKLQAMGDEETDPITELINKQAIDVVEGKLQEVLSYEEKLSDILKKTA